MITMTTKTHMQQQLQLGVMSINSTKQKLNEEVPYTNLFILCGLDFISTVGGPVWQHISWVTYTLNVDHWTVNFHHTPLPTRRWWGPSYLALVRTCEPVTCCTDCINGWNLQYVADACIKILAETTLPLGTGFFFCLCVLSHGIQPPFPFLEWSEKKSAASCEEMHMHETWMWLVRRSLWHVLVVCNSVFGGTREGEGPVVCTHSAAVMVILSNHKKERSFCQHKLLNVINNRVLFFFSLMIYLCKVYFSVG